MPDEFVIDLEAVTNKLSRISVRKAPGPDGLPNWVLRDYCTLLAGPVCAICNASRGRCAISLERIQRHSNVKSTATAVDRNGFATDLIDCDTHWGNYWSLSACSESTWRPSVWKRRSTTHALIDMLHHWHSAVDKGKTLSE